MNYHIHCVLYMFFFQFCWFPHPTEVLVQMHFQCIRATRDRHLADGNVHCAGSAAYQICFRLRSRTQTLNHITDPNPKINKKKRHRNKIEHRVISKCRFPRDGWVYKRTITGTGKETHMDIPVF